MTPLASRDVQALELGFLADRVIDALQGYSTGIRPINNPGDVETAGALLQGLASGVGADLGEVDVSLRLNAINSFGYAAEALRTSRAGNMPEGLRNHFARLAETLNRVGRGEEPGKEDLDQALAFFRGLSDATLASWGVAQLGMSPSKGKDPWTMS